MLHLLPNVADLFVHNNQIGSRGVAALAASPPAGQFSELSMWSNRIGDEGFRALADALQQRRLRVRHITIHQNKAELQAKDRLLAACDDLETVVQMR